MESSQKLGIIEAILHTLNEKLLNIQSISTLKINRQLKQVRLVADSEQ